MKLLIPSNVELELTEPADVDVITYDPASTVPEPHEDAEVVVAWGNASGTLADAATRLKRLRLVQSLAAGPEDAVSAGFRPEVKIASGRGLHSETVAEHALALILACIRRIHLMRDAQRERRWPSELGGIQSDRPPGAVTTLKGARVTIWGFGDIARHLAPLVAQLGADVLGVARSERMDNGFSVHSSSELPWLLPRTDVLVLILPSTPGTRRIVGANVFDLLPEHSHIVNVGRGDTVDEAALITALTRRHIASAALDVFEQEPLPSESPLWQLANVIVSPHAAGGRPRGAERLITENLKRLASDEPLINEVDRERGY